MVYAFVERTPYSSLVGTSIVGPKGGGLKHVEFLDPSSLDQAAKISSLPLTEGYPVNPASVPKAINWESKNKKLPDVIKCRGSDVVSETVRAIIERFEPGVHQLLPVNVCRPKEQEPFARHYWLVVCCRIDSADVNHTTLERYPSGVWTGGSGKFVFSRAAIGGAHMWRDPFIVGSTLCSQALGEAFAEAKLTGLYLQPLDEI